MSIDNRRLKDLSGAEYSKGLTGVGINLLASDVSATVKFLSDVLGLATARANEDFAIVTHEGTEFMIHSDASYSQNPLLGLTGDGVIRGAGIELRVYDVDPDITAKKAEEKGFHILQEPSNKGHGMREAFIIGPDGYCWVPSKPTGMS